MYTMCKITFGQCVTEEKVGCKMVDHEIPKKRKSEKYLIKKPNKRERRKFTHKVIHKKLDHLVISVLTMTYELTLHLKARAQIQKQMGESKIRENVVFARSSHRMK